MTNRLSLEVRTFPVFNVTSYFFHSPEIFETVVLANTVLPSVLSSESVSGPEKSSPRA